MNDDEFASAVAAASRGVKEIQLHFQFKKEKQQQREWSKETPTLAADAVAMKFPVAPLEAAVLINPPPITLQVEMMAREIKDLNAKYERSNRLYNTKASQNDGLQAQLRDMTSKIEVLDQSKRETLDQLKSVEESCRQRAAAASNAELAELKAVVGQLNAVHKQEQANIARVVDQHSKDALHFQD